MFIVEYVFSQTANLAGLAALFVILGSFVGRPWRRSQRPIAADLTFFYTQGIFTRAGILLGLAALVALGGSPSTDVEAGGFIASWPLWLQVTVVYLAWELVIYWQHRLLHGSRVWRVHAVHHSSTEVDWLSTYRMHPVEVMFYLVSIPPLLWVGFSITCFIWISSFRLVHNALVHADLPWTFGPFRYVFVSPVFHRWHHETSQEALAKNFASGLCLYDLMFGTYYLPSNRMPRSFGIPDPVPSGFIRQVAYPFRQPS